MSNYTALYLFVKLDDIRDILINCYGWTLLVLLGSVVFAGVVAIAASEEKETIKKDELWLTFSKRVKGGIIALLIVFTSQAGFNLMGTALPSTGQMAAIYLGGKVSNSDTANTLSRLPAKYATLLENKADEWLTAQLPKPKE